VNEVKELTIEATPENVDTVIEFVDAQLEEYGCGMKEQMAIDVAIDELFANIAHYAYNPETGYATVRVDVLQDPLSVEVTFIDNGKQYDPLAKDDPDTTLSVEDRPIGGMGILIVKKSMDAVNYEYKDGRNILTIKKNI
jgi:anti-sigma regulatory factor (Ser/Thr protein kinase)